MLIKLKKRLYLITGLVLLLLAVIGVILPLVPTTPFALLSLYCFDRSSKKFHIWVLNFPLIGEGMNDWKKHRVIRKKAKIQAITLIAISIILTLLRESILIEIKIVVSLVLTLVCIFLYTRNSER